MYNHTIYHHGIKGMKWGKRRFQNKDGSLTPAGKQRYDDDGPSKTGSKKKAVSRSKSGERTFNALKKAANAALDKADRDNFFNSKSIFSEESMKRQSRIDRARDAINNMDYKTLTSPKGAKHLVDAGKKFVRDSMDDADTRDFFNKDWDTRMDNQEKRDIVRNFLDDLD